MRTNHFRLNTAIVILVFCFFSNNSFAQITDKNTTFWGAVVPAFKIAENVKIKNEFHWRTSDFMGEWMQFIIRPSITYTPMKGLSLTAGYTYANNHPYHGFSGPIAFPESNIWEQVALTSTYGKVKVTNQFRMEHRWIGIVNSANTEPFIDGNNFANRFRYRLIGNVPIFKMGEIPVSLTLFNEIMVVLTDKFRPINVNQNWMVGLVNFHLPLKSKVSIGIQNQYIIRGGGDRISNMALWLALSKEFDLTSKNKENN